ncbi:MAG: propionyl-CoA carboxylase [Myxococcales bacterium]|nr:propionyl-CoA carboxylase [Myxococcales bacterium]
MARFTLHPIGSELGAAVGPDEAERNATHMASLDDALAADVDTVRRGWGDKYVDRVHAKGKMTAWERIDSLKDEGAELFCLGTFVNWGREFEGSRRPSPGAGVITGITRVAGRLTVVVANDNTVASGAWWPLTPEKIQRAQQVALRLRLPIVYLVDCSGLFLPEQSNSFAGPTGAGHIFTMNARLADAGVPQVAAVFGDCIAGGGYMPIISDHVVMTEQAYMVIAGAALIKGAKSLHLTSLDIGGPEVHVHQSRCADERAPDDDTAIRIVRQTLQRLPGSAADFYRYGASAQQPRFAPEELAKLFPQDPRQAYDVEQVIARLVDGSLFHEFLPDVGREMVTGVARVGGLWVGLIANRQGIVDEPGIGRRAGGVLYREGIAKISTFSRACGEDGIPVVWLQDISGFDIGVQAEHLGLLGFGSNLIYGNSTQPVPFFTVLLRKASGAGFYAMSGIPYEPVVQLSTPMTRLAVMEGRTLAIAAFNSKLDDDFEIRTTDPEERAQIEAGMAETAARIDRDMDPMRAASVMDTDEVVPVSQLRGWLECLVEAAWQQTGYRRTKNPRIWSLHEIEVLAAPRRALGMRTDAALLREDSVCAPTVGTFQAQVSAGATVTAGSLLGVIRQAGSSVSIVAPDGASGMAVDIADGEWVDRGVPLLVLRAASASEAVAEAASEDAASQGVPEDVTVVRADTDGLFFARPDPAAPSFVAVGGTVEPSATLGLVEVMKTFTPLRSPCAGVVRRVLVSDGDSVQSGQALFWIGPAAPTEGAT